ncbi:MAG: glycosyltransferase, partial [Thermoleophilia bacterium]|nr:glycosyltransferase [Thermoleophilia bacterium]
MKVAYYSPLPPERSGVADYSALLVPALARRVGLRLVRRGRRRPPRGTDVSLYHVGNDHEVHGWIVDALRARPGVVVLHDVVLHHLVAGLTLGRGDVPAYLQAMERDRGVVGRLLALGAADGCLPWIHELRPDEFPLTNVVLDAAERGVVVHSRYAERRVRETGYGGRVWRIPHPAWPAPPVPAAELGPGPVIGCLGVVNASKRIPQLLEAFALVREAIPAARLLIAGPVRGRFDLDRRLAEAALPAGSVIREPYVDEQRFWALLAASDVCVSLRSPTMGETSGSAVRALSLGKPLVVSELGWFAELPDDVAVKVPDDEREVPRLAAALRLLLERDDLRLALGERARAYAASEHDLERVAEQY